MSNTPLLKQINPFQSAQRGLQVTGQIPIAKLERLSASLVDSQGFVEVELVFGVDEEKIRTLQGVATAKVRLACQRCLEPVAIELQATLNLGMVTSEEAAKNLPGRYDPLVVAEPVLELHSVVEDELILCLPLIPQHDDCEIQTSFGEAEAPAVEEVKKPNPFSVLAQLKAKK